MQQQPSLLPMLEPHLYLLLLQQQRQQQHTQVLLQS
jgi:hypothetical protein